MVYLTLGVDDGFVYVANGFATIREGLERLVVSDWVKDNACNYDTIVVNVMESDVEPDECYREAKAKEGYISAESKYLLYAADKMNKGDKDYEFYSIVLGAEIDRLVEELGEALEFDNKKISY